jgi:glutaredoxin
VGARKEEKVYQREVVLYTGGHSLNSWRAKRFLRYLGYRFDVIDTRRDSNVLVELSEAVQHRVSLPYIFVGERPVGDLGVVRKLARSGILEHLVCDQL